MMLFKPRVLFNYTRFMNVKVKMYPGFVKEKSTFRFEVFPFQFNVTCPHALFQQNTKAAG